MTLYMSSNLSSTVVCAVCQLCLQTAAASAGVGLSQSITLTDQ